HNGREVDAEAVKLNLLRIKDPAIGTDWHRGVVENIETVDVVDKYMVRLHTRVPDVAVPANVVFYPTNLVVYPNSADNSIDFKKPVKSSPLTTLWRGQGHGLTPFFLPARSVDNHMALPHVASQLAQTKRDQCTPASHTHHAQAHPLHRAQSVR